MVVLFDVWSRLTGAALAVRRVAASPLGAAVAVRCVAANLPSGVLQCLRTNATNTLSRTALAKKRSCRLP